MSGRPLNPAGVGAAFAQAPTPGYYSGEIDVENDWTPRAVREEAVPSSGAWGPLAATRVMFATFHEQGIPVQQFVLVAPALM